METSTYQWSFDIASPSPVAFPTPEKAHTALTMPSTLHNEAQALRRIDQRHLLHPWQHFKSFEKEGALLIEKGEGAYIEDVEGRRYLDAIGGLWCTNIGLGSEEVAEAIAAQAKELAYANPFTDMGAVRSTELAAKLAELAPGSLNRVIFSTGGSTAVDTAARLARFYQKSRGACEKRHLISRHLAYHGSTYLSASLSGRDRVPELDYIEDKVHLVSAPDYYRAPEGLSEAEFCDQLIEELEGKILSIGPDRVAAFFAEPIMGSGGVIVPPEDYNRRTWEICKKHDVLYVADEVVTAFGRLGHWFASEAEFGIEPDIITSAKGMTSGYVPLGATLYSDQIHEVISQGDPARVFAHGFTYSGHPVSCAAALKVIEIMQRERILDHVQEVGPYFESRLEEIRALPLVGDVRGRKFMMCVEFVANKDTKELFPESMDIGHHVAGHCEQLGLIVRPLVHLNVMSPALILTKQEIDFIVDKLRDGIVRTQRDLGIT